MPELSGVYACPDGELILEHGAARELWLAERRKGIGGSDMAALMHQAKYGNTEYQVWLDKTGRGVDLEQTEAMEWGSRLEDAVAEKFGDETGIGSVQAGLMRHTVEHQVLASVDRLTDDGEGLECKNQSWWMAKEYGSNETPLIPRQFYWQMVTYMAVTGRRGWWLASLCGGQKLVIRHLERYECEEDIARVLQVVPEWWLKHVLGDEAPIDGQPAEELKTDKGAMVEASFPELVYADYRRWQELRAELKAGEEELGVLKARFKAELGSHELLTVRGIPIVRMQHRRNPGKFNRKGLAAKYPEIEREFAPTSVSTSHFPVLIGKDDDDE